MYLKRLSRDIVKEIEVKRLSRLLPLKKTITFTHLLLSLSILSLLSSSTLLVVYYQNLHYFSTNTCQLTRIAMNKNFIFLICNGILVFLAKTSASARPPSPSDLDHKRSIGYALEEETEAEETLSSDKHIISLGGEETINPYQGEELDEVELRDCCLFEDVDDRDQEVCDGGEEVDEIEKLSDDELNQKFEDFIRRMKEEFQINDYQRKQLVLVN